jgi:hypothetical protein
MRFYPLRIRGRLLVVVQSAVGCGFGFCRKVASDNVQYLLRCGAFYISAAKRTA